MTSDKNYTTDNSAGGNDELQAKAMLADLNSISGSDRLVTITSHSSHPQSDPRYLPPISPRPAPQGGSLAGDDGCARGRGRSLGGTHNAFNPAALAPGAGGPAGSPTRWSAGGARARATAWSPRPVRTAFGRQPGHAQRHAQAGQPVELPTARGRRRV